MKRTVVLTLIMVALFSIMMIGTSNAAIMAGDKLRIEWFYPDTSTYWGPSGSPIDVVVGAGVEVPDIAGYGQIDIDVSGASPNILIDFGPNTANWASGAFNGFRISDYTGTVADFTSVTIDGITNVASFDISRVTFGADEIWINFQSLIAPDGTQVGLNVDSASVPVPEPSTLLLLGSGLVGLVVIGRRKFRK